MATTKTATIETTTATDAEVAETTAQGERLLRLMADQEKLSQLRRAERELAAKVKTERDSGVGKLEAVIARQLATLPIWDRRSVSNRVYRRVIAGQTLDAAIAGVLEQLGNAAREDIANKEEGKPSLGLDAPAKAATPAPAE